MMVTMNPDPLATPLAVGSLAVSVATFILGTIVSVVIYKLGRRVDFRSRMRRWDELRTQTNQLHLTGQTNDLRELILMNARRYEKDYDGGNDANRHGFVMGKYELVDAKHNGVELITRVAETWVRDDGSLSVRPLSRKSRELGRGANVFEVGFVPFDYIEHINPSGDEYRAEPIFFVKHRGPGKSPVTSYRYVETESYRLRPEGRQYFRRITELGEVRPNRLRAWVRFQKTRWILWRMDRASERKMRELGLPGRRR